MEGCESGSCWTKSLRREVGMHSFPTRGPSRAAGDLHFTALLTRARIFLKAEYGRTELARALKAFLRKLSEARVGGSAPGIGVNGWVAAKSCLPRALDPSFTCRRSSANPRFWYLGASILASAGIFSCPRPTSPLGGTFLSISILSPVGRFFESPPTQDLCPAVGHRYSRSGEPRESLGAARQVRILFSRCWLYIGSLRSRSPCFQLRLVQQRRLDNR
jgi:hypothetical protein